MNNAAPPPPPHSTVAGLLRRRDQATVAVVVAVLLAVIVARQLLDRRSVDFDRLPQRRAAFIVDVNTASAAELAELPGIGEKSARRIVDYRNEHGPFRTVDELIEVQGIGRKTLEAVRPHVRLGPAPP